MAGVYGYEEGEVAVSGDPLIEGGLRKGVWRAVLVGSPDLTPLKLGEACYSASLSRSCLERTIADLSSTAVRFGVEIVAVPRELREWQGRTS
jgi:hypothetical protein